MVIGNLSNDLVCIKKNEKSFFFIKTGNIQGNFRKLARYKNLVRYRKLSLKLANQERRWRKTRCFQISLNC